MHAVRMQLQIDTVPTMATVEQWARSLQAELEMLAVSGAEQGPNVLEWHPCKAKVRMGILVQRQQAIGDLILISEKLAGSGAQKRDVRGERIASLLILLRKLVSAGCVVAITRKWNALHQRVEKDHHQKLDSQKERQNQAREKRILRQEARNHLRSRNPCLSRTLQILPKL